MSRFVHHRCDPEEYEARRSGDFHRRRVDLVVAGLRTADRPMEAVLEIGCGTGSVLGDVAAILPDTAFWGIDLEPPLIEYAQRTHAAPNVTWIVAADVEAVARSFDGIYSIDVLHHVDDHARLFRSVQSVLAPGGRWVVVEPNIFHPYMAWQQGAMRRSGLDEDHFRPWRMLPLLRAAGFKVMSRSYAHLFPATIKSVPRSMARIERTLERAPVLGASVVLVLSV